MDITKEGVSKYANILVLHPHIDLEPRAQEFRELLCLEPWCLREIPMDKLAGGPKVFTQSCFAGCYSYFDAPEFIRQVRAFGLVYECTVLACGGEDEMWSGHTIA